MQVGDREADGLGGVRETDGAADASRGHGYTPKVSHIVALVEAEEASEAPAKRGPYEGPRATK